MPEASASVCLLQATALISKVNRISGKMEGEKQPETDPWDLRCDLLIYSVLLQRVKLPESRMIICHFYNLAATRLQW